jgi:hypothetical protein
MTEYGLGRIYIPDERDHQHLMRTIMPQVAPERSYRYWSAGWRGNQGAKPWCVAFAWFHWLEMMGRLGEPDAWDPSWLYANAQLVDQWAGEDYDGTSVRAGGDVLRRENTIQEYRWSWSVSEVEIAVLTESPVVVGSKWTNGMFTPDTDGFIWPTGGSAGGHAWVISGVNRDKRVFRMDNSWGTDWGDHGRAFLTYEVLEELLDDQGEAAVAVI